MDDSSYKGGGTPASKWGCGAAAVVGVPIFLLLTIVDALGDCAPGLRCDKGFWTHVALPTVAIATAIGFSVAWLVGRLIRWRG